MSPAAATANETAASETRCKVAADMFRSDRPRRSCTREAPTPLSTAAPSATIATMPPWTGCGCTSRGDRVDRDEAGDGEQQTAVGESREDGRPVVAERPGHGGTSQGVAQRDDGDGQPGDVRQIVPCIGKKPE